MAINTNSVRLSSNIALLIFTALSGFFARAADETPALKKLWFNGDAELSSYDLEFNRYDEKRFGTAVTIFVTETIDLKTLVKTEKGEKKTTAEVMKLNLVEDFPTGIYDYNLMTSAFVPFLKEAGAFGSTPLKVTFSAQEWCGHVWSQILRRKNGLQFDSHSYFDREADQSGELSLPKAGVWLFEDALPIWARGLSAPFLDPGASQEIDVLGSAKIARLSHQPINWQKATLTKNAKTEQVKVSAGTFEVRKSQVRFKQGPVYTFFIEEAFPHHLVKWELSQSPLSQKAELIKTSRMKYWQMNDSKSIEGLGHIGLKPRPKRTP